DLAESHLWAGQKRGRSEHLAAMWPARSSGPPGTKSVLARGSAKMVPDFGTISRVAPASDQMVPLSGTKSAVAPARRDLVPLLLEPPSCAHCRTVATDTEGSPMSTTLEIYRDLMRDAEPTDA